MSGDVERGDQGLEYSFGQCRCLGSVAQALAEHHELVAAEAGDAVGVARRGTQTFCDTSEQFVAERMA